MAHRSQTLSAVLITHNNAETLTACLESIRWVDELLAVDLGSIDGTLDILKRFLVTTHFHPSVDPVVHQQFLIDNATKEWVLAIEPNEIMPEMLRHEIDGALMNTGSVNGFEIRTNTLLAGEPLALLSDYSPLRLFRRKVARPLDQIGLSGFAVNDPIELLQNSFESVLPENLDWILSQLDKLAANQVYQTLSETHGELKASSQLSSLLKPTGAFLSEAIIKGQAFKGNDGLRRSWLKTMAVMIKAEKHNQLAAQTKQIIS